jgi:hypothetical protein
MAVKWAIHWTALAPLIGGWVPAEITLPTIHAHAASAKPEAICRALDKSAGIEVPTVIDNVCC